MTAYPFQNLRELGKTIPNRRRLGICVFQGCVLFLLVAHGISYGDTIRKPVVAGKFYPASAPELIKTIQYFTEEASKTEVKIPSAKALKALIMPHAGIVYSGLTAAHASLALKEKQFSKVILMGPDHRIGFPDCAVSDVDVYQTPLGTVALHADASKLRRSSALFKAVPLSDAREHCLEVVLPFLQVYLNDFQLVPIVMGRVSSINGVMQSLLNLVDDDTLVVVSTDLSHYLSYAQAKTLDMATIQCILELNDAELSRQDNVACGLMPVLVLMKMAQKNEWKPVFIHYSNSGDTAGDKDAVVGYTAIAFYGDGAYEKKE